MKSLGINIALDEGIVNAKVPAVSGKHPISESEWSGFVVVDMGLMKAELADNDGEAFDILLNGLSESAEDIDSSGGVLFK